MYELSRAPNRLIELLDRSTRYKRSRNHQRYCIRHRRD